MMERSIIRAQNEKARDRRKDRFLRKNGYRKVIRVTGSDIVSKMPEVLERIEKVL
ncbi:hypothetical protein PMEGAS67_55310 [Priestia megaterium]